MIRLVRLPLEQAANLCIFNLFLFIVFKQVEVPDLPNIALPIGKKGLPSFNFSDPQSKPSPAVTPFSLFGSPANGSPKKPASSLPPAYGGQGGRSNFVEDTPAAPSKPNANPTSQVTPMMTSTPFSGNFTAPQFKFSTPQAKQEEEGSGINFTFSEPAVKGSSFGKDSLPTKAAEGVSNLYFLDVVMSSRHFQLIPWMTRSFLSN